MKTKKYIFSLVICLALATCGGGGGSDDGENGPDGDDQFDFVPDETPVSELLGDWRLEATAHTVDCPETAYRVDEDMDEGEEEVELTADDFGPWVRNVRISESECLTKKMDLDTDKVTREECRAGGKILGAAWSLQRGGWVSKGFDESESCDVVEAEEWTAELNESDQLEGSFVVNFTSEEINCNRWGYYTVGCRVEGSVTGTRTWDPASGESPPSFPTTEDFDGDGHVDNADNCPYRYNPGQEDSDGDGVGDHCGADTDSDGIADIIDNCPEDYNPDQADDDGDGVGNECDDDWVSDSDWDEDGIIDDEDNCIRDWNPDQADSDGDGRGDICEHDNDGDGVIDDDDNCVFYRNEDQVDTDGDGIGNACDDDRDGDGIYNGPDNCPDIANEEQEDFDRDGVGNICDDDLDGDGVFNDFDNCPYEANEDQEDEDDDGIGDVCEPIVLDINPWDLIDIIIIRPFSGGSF